MSRACASEDTYCILVFALGKASGVSDFSREGKNLDFYVKCSDMRSYVGQVQLVDDQFAMPGQTDDLLEGLRKSITGLAVPSHAPESKACTVGFVSIIPCTPAPS
jgi:hypothetical protein